ncbi:hypothetical protein OUZ56_013033 [Daphnia magna]|uniref:Uncharacterized protein n=1 Tax=Daphnia magna TaxID=35525 RepID=A0ABQ9Z5I6_9CRUS|nr:hypothetical protein OUZ56_013033 [Daphnia magna]
MDDLRSVRSAPKVKITYLIAKKATRSARGRALSSTMVWTVVELLEKISGSTLIDILMNHKTEIELNCDELVNEKILIEHNLGSG